MLRAAHASPPTRTPKAVGARPVKRSSPHSRRLSRDLPSSRSAPVSLALVPPQSRVFWPELTSPSLGVSLADGSPVAVTDVCAHRNNGIVRRPGPRRNPHLPRPFLAVRPAHRAVHQQCFNRPDRVASHPCRVADGWVDVLVPDPAPVLGIRAMLLAAARQERGPGEPASA
jgi:hypothetical protein